MQLRVCLSVLFAALTGLASAATVTPPAAVVVKDAKGVAYAGDATAGEKAFKQCMICHSTKTGENKIGPTLFGVVGRVAGTTAGYSFSPANKKSGITWTEQALFDYLENPRVKMPGTKMGYAGLKKPQDRANLIAYLKTLKAGAKPK